MCLLPQIEVDRFGSVPKFLCDAVQVLERHASTEGLFRKSGSLARQKDLKVRLLISNGCTPAQNTSEILTPIF